MPAKRKHGDDRNDVIILLDTRLSESSFGIEILPKIEEYFSASKSQVGACIECLDIPFSVRWLTRQKDNEEISDAWREERHMLYFYPVDKLFQKLESTTSTDSTTLIHSILNSEGYCSLDVHKVHLVLIERDVIRNNSSARQRVRVQERQRLLKERLVEFAVECSILHGVDVDIECRNADECAALVIRATKSILQLSSEHNNCGSYSDGGDVSWYPRKVGPPVGVAKNDSRVGLELLWQKQMVQVSKALGPERAKVIGSHPDFSSPSACMHTFSRCQDESEGEKALAVIRLRPTGGVEDLIGLCSKPNIGSETAKKFYRFMTSVDGNAFI